MGVTTAPRRGRPPKFGRPAQLVTLTLPEDVISWLSTIDPDLGWAIGRGEQYADSNHQDQLESMALYDLLEKVIDRCRDAGNVINHIVLKNS